MKVERCLLCFSDIESHITIYNWLRQDTLLCGDCEKELIYLGICKNLDGLKIHILYLYNDFLENMIYQFKEGRDIALKNCFFHAYGKEFFHKFRHYQMCILPSSKEKLEQRGFSHLSLMLEQFSIQIECPFEKLDNHKQSLQIYEKRKDIYKHIRLKEHFKLKKKKILLIDDVCTSGSTLRCAYDLLKQHTTKIEALVLCANPRFVELCDER